MFRSQYWSTSKLADAIRGTVKPNSATMSDWNTWNKTAKSKHPIRYWIAEDLLNTVQDTINFVPDKINNFRYYLNNRFYTKTHALTSNLPRGQFHEFDTRLLNCAFDELVNFVEVEKSWILVCWSDDYKQKYAVPLSRKKWWLRWFSEWRCEEAGIEYLDWEISLTNDWCDKDHPEYGKPSAQAITAKETKDLYMWWKYQRPQRVDPHEASGWTDICRENDKDFFSENKSPSENARIRAALDKSDALEKQYDDEDESMLLRLIKIRKSLWT